jgi:hypothetical protein
MISISNDKMDSQLEQSTTDGTEYLDHHRWLPIVLLLLLPLAVHLPLWLLGRSMDPIWFFSGLAHGQHPVRWPFLDPNVGFTSEALGRLAAWDWVHGIVPWWNPYSGIGMPLAGELQPGAFFLPFNLLLLLGEGILWQQILMQIIAGLATFALVRELGLSRLAALIAGILFELNGTIAWTPGPASVYCSLPFLPLLLWGVERSRREKQGALSILIIGTATAWSILAGFPEPAYIGGLLVFAWAIYRLVSDPMRWLVAQRAIAGWLLGMLIAAPVLIAFVDYVRESDSFGLHNLGELSLPWAAFSATLMPYVYGSLGTSLQSVPLSRIWDNIGGYTGTLTILMAIVGLKSKSAHRGLKFVLLVWILLAWAKTFGVPPITTWMNHIPLMRQTNFFRYSSPSWDFALIILAAFGLDDLRDHSPRLSTAFAVVIGLLTIGIALAWPQRGFWERPKALVPIMFVPLGLSLVWVLAGLTAAGLSWKWLQGERRRVALASVLVVDATLMFMLPQLTSTRRGQIDTEAMQFLRDHQGLHRTYTLGPIEPNYSAYFGVASIDHNVVPAPKLWASYVESKLLPGFATHNPGFYSLMTFWPGTMAAGEAEQALSQNLKDYLNLGVQYLVTKPSQSPIPMIWVPSLPQKNSSEPPATQSITPRLGKLIALAARSQATIQDPTKSPVQHFLAKTILTVLQPILGNGSHDAIPQSWIPDQNYVTLERGQSVKVKVLAPKPVSGSPITSLGVTLTTSGAGGILTIEICAGKVCQTGQRSLDGTFEDSVFLVPLVQPLSAAVQVPLDVTLGYRDGSRPVMLGMAAGQEIQEANAISPERSVQLIFEYGLALPGIRIVYSDSVMNIWELPNPAPYFEVISGGPCTLSTAGRDELTAECTAPARLLRKELYMSGWRVKVNGTPAVAVQPEGVFQAIPLSTGRSHLRFHFAPPYVGFGWAASMLGIVGLISQVVLIARRPIALPLRQGF